MAERLNLSVQQLQALLDAPPELRPDLSGGTDIHTRLPDITYDKDRNNFPVNLYVPREAFFTMNVFGAVANVSVVCQGLFLRPDGMIIPFAQTVVAPTDRSRAKLSFSLGEGFLLSAALLSSGVNVRRGQVFANLTLDWGGPGVAVTVSEVMQGYVSTFSVPIYPNGRQDFPLDPPGILRSITGTQPAAGANILEVVPTGARWRLRSIHVRLVTANAGGTRTVQLGIDDTISTFLQLQPNQTQALNTTVDNFATAGSFLGVAAAGSTYWSLPPDVVLFQGWAFRTSVLGINAADQFAAPIYEVEEWLEP
jgi:hypothetical protein